MAGAYCMYCGHRCFVLRRLPDTGREMHMATCSAGKDHDQIATGFTADTAINPYEQQQERQDEVAKMDGMLRPVIRDALIAGRDAATILEAVPEDEEHGYSKEEEDAQFAAVDRLVAAFRTLDRELNG